MYIRTKLSTNVLHIYVLDIREKLLLKLYKKISDFKSSSTSFSRKIQIVLSYLIKIIKIKKEIKIFEIYINIFYKRH